jgi:sterol 3beta-glucosyltransferase
MVAPVLRELLFEVSGTSTVQKFNTDKTAGIPTIIKPFFGDQAFWSERVESLGVGSAVRKLTAEHLTEALLKATTDEKQIAKAKIVGEMIRKENGVAKAIEAIYRDLEYAKSIVKPAPNKETDHDGPLNKVTSLLHPITSSDSSPFRRSRSRKSGGEQDQEKLVAEAQPENEAKEGDGSEESWDVVSTEGTEEEKETSQPPVRTEAAPEVSRSDSQPQPQPQPQSQGQYLGLGKPLS